MSTPTSVTDRLIRLAESVRLRREHFGGIAFDTRTGTTVDLDVSAFRLLKSLEESGPRPEGQLVNDALGRKRKSRSCAKAAELVAALLDDGILTAAIAARVDHGPGHGGPVVDEADTPGTEEGPAPRGPHLVAPETVHWAVTYRCSSDCPECYARRHAHWFPDELDAHDALCLVETLADWGVFQLALGGGEPLLCRELPTIAKHARQHGLVVHVTTGQHQVDARLLAELAEGTTGLQIGVKTDRLLADSRTEVAALAETVASARETGLHVGANVILSNAVVEGFEHVLQLLEDAGLTRVTLLRYKPPTCVEQWQRDKPSPASLRAFEADLPAVIERHPALSLRLDCALTFLQRRLTTEGALAAGIRGCVAADRILALTPDGSAFPCSQLVHPELLAGNLLTDELHAVWAESQVLRRYRLFRGKSTFKGTTCGLCAAKSHCGGCRVFAHDGWGAEPECPEPLLPPLTQLGKAGRRWELARYFQQCGWITVGDYMQRYGVGQKRAVKELRAFGCTCNSDSGTGRKRADVYHDPTEDLVDSIQESIGFTSAGFPYATREEIAAGLAENSDEAYDHFPQWLREGS